MDDFSRDAVVVGGGDLARGGDFVPSLDLPIFFNYQQKLCIKLLGTNGFVCFIVVLVYSATTFVRKRQCAANAKVHNAATNFNRIDVQLVRHKLDRGKRAHFATNVDDVLFFALLVE